MSRVRSGRYVPAAALVVATTCLLLGCSGPTGQQSESPTSSASSLSSAQSPSSSQSESPSRSESPAPPASLPPDATATASPTLAEREDAEPATKRVQAAAAEPTATLKYTDGLTVSLGKATFATVTAQGPGELTGLQYSLIPVTVTNGSDRTLNLNNVIVELRYGSPARIAQPVYAEGTEDLSGTLKPGASTQATYAFAVTKDKLSDVTLSLDIDGQHGLGEFKGELP